MICIRCYFVFLKTGSKFSQNKFGKINICGMDQMNEQIKIFKFKYTEKINNIKIIFMYFPRY